MALETLYPKEIGEPKQPLHNLSMYTAGPWLVLWAILCGLLVKFLKKAGGFGINLLNEGLKPYNLVFLC